MNPRDVEDIYPLSPIQHGVLFHSLMADGEDGFFRQLTFIFRGPLEGEPFRQAWQEVLDRHPILRTAFIWDEVEDPVQVVCRRVELPFDAYDWRREPPGRRERLVEDLRERDRRRGFAFAEAPLLRLAVLRLEDDVHWVVLSYHHILVDGWSLALIMNQVASCYRSRLAGRPPAIPRSRPYRDYVGWLRSRDMAAAEAFWRRTLDGFSTPTSIGFERPGSDPLAFVGQTASCRSELPESLAAALAELGRRRRLTLNTLIQGAWAILLSRTGNSRDVVFGATVSGRPTDLSGFEQMVGLFINTLPVRVRIDPAAALVTHLERLQGEHVEARQYEFTPLLEIQKWSPVERGGRLFDSILVFENYPMERSGDQRALRVVETRMRDSANYPLTVIIKPRATLQLRILYDVDRFEGTAVARALGQFAELLTGMARRPDLALEALRLLPRAQRRQLLVEWNDTAAAYPGPGSIPEAFAAQARRTPSAPALIFEERQLSYGELAERVSRLAWRLRSSGVGPEALVGVYLERSVELVVTLLAILEAGAAFLPLDPESPPARLGWMMEDAELRWVVSSGELASRLPESRAPEAGARVLRAEAEGTCPGTGQGADPPAAPSPEQLAYVIYTSGSTGRPKGVMNRHGAIRNGLFWMQSVYGLGPGDRVLQKTPATFDVSVWEFFLPLMFGATLVVARPGGHRDAGYLVEVMSGLGITMVHFVPSMLRAFLEHPEVERCTDLRRVISSGEALAPELASRFHSRLGAHLDNLYGPTEAAVHVTWSRCRRSQEESVVAIGRPIANTRLRVSDPGLRPVGAGVPGQLCLGGVGLARGYLARPGLTAERFVPDPCGAAGSRLYQTGDLVRQRADGAMEFLGRLDHQVKVRGYRIELGEIEASLRGHRRIDQAVVVTSETGGGPPRLVAYLVVERRPAPSTSELHGFLRERLPEYMVPAVFVVLDAFPLTASGKVDRRALPEPGTARPDLEKELVPPRTPVERTLAEIWEQALRVDRIGIDDNFFELGGDSILAIRIIAQCHHEGLRFEPRRLFDHPTVAALAARLEPASADAPAVPEKPPAPFELAGLAPEVLARWRAEEPEIEDVYPLAPAQKEMLFLYLYAERGHQHFQQQVHPLPADLDVEAYRSAWQLAVDRHPVLRTAYRWQDLDEPVQVVFRRVELPFEVLDWRQLDAEEARSKLRRYQRDDRARGFDLTRAPAMRFAVVRLPDGDPLLIWCRHHILFDGWSVSMLTREVRASYRALSAGETPSPEPGWPYRDYIAWLNRQGTAAAEAYWRAELAGFTAPTRLAIDRAPDGESEEGADLRGLQRSLPPAVTAKLKARAREHRLTLNTLVQGAWALILSLYSGERDVVYGNTSSGRPATLPGVESIVGLFLSTLPVRVRLPAAGPVGPWLHELQGRQAELRRYEHCQLAQVQGWSEVPAKTSLFHTLLIFQNAQGEREEGRKERSRVGARTRGFARIIHPLMVFVIPGEELVVRVRYHAERFAEPVIRRLTHRFLGILESLAAGGEQEIGALLPLAPSEAQQLLREWNDTTVHVPSGSDWSALFSAQAERTPEAVAVACGGEVVSYRRLLQSSLRLAAELRRRGVGRGSVVALLADRGVGFLTAVLGVMRAGGAYLPLDPLHPAPRQAQVLERGGARWLIYGDELRPRVKEVAAELEARFSGRPLGELPLGELSGRGCGTPAVDIGAGTGPGDLAYVIFTSGSTGTPKGAMVEQRGMINHLCAKVADLELGPGDVVAQTASQCFDISVWQFLAALMVGGRVEVFPDSVAHDPRRLVDDVVARRVSILETVPSLLGLILDELGPGTAGSAPPALRWLIPTGEALPPALARRWLESYPGIPLLNAYGPTECSDDVSHHPIRRPPPPAVVHVPIGQPIGNLRLHVVDARMRLLRAGVHGELVAAGVGVGRGYLADPGRTAAVFIPDPWALSGGVGGGVGGGNTAGSPGARLYRTGDLARFLPDGVLEFLGRLDHQVKVRGFRIELGEVEHCLRRRPEVREAVVVARRERSGDQRLTAYVVPGPECRGPSRGGSGGETLPALRAALREELPEYMVPSAVVLLDRLPLTANGKVDRRALPDPEPEDAGAASGGAAEAAPGEAAEAASGEAPRGSIEDLLAEIFAEHLGLEGVSRHDDFFELGGHSLLAMRVMSRLRSVFEIEMELRQLFDTPTVAELAKAVSGAIRELFETPRAAALGGGERIASPPLEPVTRQGPLPLSFSQQRLWFLDQLNPGNPAYNLPLVVRFEHRPDVAALEYALSEVMRRHECLRTEFPAPAGEPRQAVLPPAAMDLPVVDLAALPEPWRRLESSRWLRAEYKRRFDLSRGPLVRPVLLRGGEEGSALLIVVHHIVTDAWANRVLGREVFALYHGARRGEPAVLPELPIQYADFAVWQQRWLRGETLERLVGYWRETLAGAPSLRLPTDRPRPRVQTFRGARRRIDLPEGLLAGLQDVGRPRGATLFMTLQAAFDTLLYRTSGQADISVGTYFASRNRAEIENLIGFFVNTLVLRTRLDGDPSFQELLDRVRKTTLGAYAHQDLPFEKLLDELNVARDLSHTPLFQVMLDFLHVSARRAAQVRRSEEATRANFDLTLWVRQGGDKLSASLAFNRALFDSTTASRLSRQLRTLLLAIVADPGRRLSAIAVLAPAERQQLVREWSSGAAGQQAWEPVHDRLAAQAEATPERPAICWDGQELSYGQLDRRAELLARHLRSLAVGPETRVGLLLDRSAELLVAILGILKASGAYVPLDPAYPRERLDFMVRDSAMPVLVTRSRWRDSWAGSDLEVVCLDEEHPWTNAEARVAERAEAGHPAYVIYTSGTTGHPKGVQVVHGALARYTSTAGQMLGIRPGDRVLQFASISFDTAAEEIFPCLTRGAALVPRTDTMLGSPFSFLEGCREAGVTVLDLPTAYWAELVAAVDAGEAALPDSVRLVVIGGEKASPEMVATWRRRVGTRPRLLNTYGPTETTIVATACDLTTAVGRRQPAGEVSIGVPLPGVRIHVVDRRLYPAPIGAPGELLIGGAGLARGYLDRPGLTAERFVPDPLTTFESGARLYRSGDLVRLRPDGRIGFLGRIDHQVKIRGFRVELGEIEDALRRHPALAEAAVAVHTAEGRPARLVAYLVAATEDSPKPSELRRHLRDRLPEHMLPAQFELLADLPRTPSGKVDRAALPEPEARRDVDEELVAPEGEFEVLLAEIWSSVLGVETIGSHDNFFELGGHSLLATQVLARVRDRLEIDLPLLALFEMPTIEELALAVEEAVLDRLEALDEPSHESEEDPVYAV